RVSARVDGPRVSVRCLHRSRRVRRRRDEGIPLSRCFLHPIDVSSIAAEEVLLIEEHSLQRCSVPSLDVQAALTPVDVIGKIVIVDPVLCGGQVPKEWWRVLFVGWWWTF